MFFLLFVVGSWYV